MSASRRHNRDNRAQARRFKERQLYHGEDYVMPSSPVSAADKLRNTKPRALTMQSIGLLVCRDALLSTTRDLISMAANTAAASLGSELSLRNIRGLQESNGLAMTYLSIRESKHSDKWTANLPAQAIGDALLNRCVTLDRQDPESQTTQSIQVEFDTVDALMPKDYWINLNGVKSNENITQEIKTVDSAGYFLVLLPKTSDPDPSKKDGQYLENEKLQMELAAGEIIAKNQDLVEGLPPRLEDEPEAIYRRRIANLYRFFGRPGINKKINQTSVKNKANFNSRHLTFSRIPGYKPKAQVAKAVENIQEVLDSLSPEQRTITLTRVQAMPGGREFKQR